MKTAAFSAAAVLSLASTALGQYDQQSKPFELIVTSADKSINGDGLSSCHEGAGLEGLCAGKAGKPSDYNTYRFNTSSNAIGSTGVLTYELKGGNFNESEPMMLYYDPSTNVALPLFEPSYTATYVGFDKSNKMYIQEFVDDTVTPPKAITPKNLYRWYVCETYYTGYTYTTLAWVMGNGKPENPSCKKVDVVRKFV